MRVGGIALVLLLVGCARHRVASPTVPSAAEAASARGNVGYRLLLDPHAAPPGEGRFMPPSPRSELPPPSYPEAALAAHADPAHVVVRITIDTSGRIADVGNSPVEASSTGPFAEAFRDAVLRALRHWRFTPGYLKSAEQGSDDQPRESRWEPVPVFYDLRFDFEIVDGEGIVRTNAPTP